MRKYLFIFLLFPWFIAASESIGENLFAVHATDVLPEEGILYAGYGKPGTLPEDIPNVRCTVHFSLGELVRPLGDWMTWENKKYAIVVPLKNLYPQLVNLNCYDTFILGDLELTKEMYLVAPEGTPSIGECSIFEYNSDTSLREAVDQLIATLGGWKVTMSDDNLDEEYAPAYVNGTNINTQEFFASFLEMIPHLSLGVRWDPLHGEAWRLANLEMLLFSKSPMNKDEIKEHRSALKRVYLKAPALSSKSKQMLKERMLGGCKTDNCKTSGCKSGDCKKSKCKSKKCQAR